MTRRKIPMGRPPRAFFEGRRAAKIRRKRGMTQHGVAAALGTTRWHVAQVERGRYRPSMAYRAALAALLGVEPERLSREEPD